MKWITREKVKVDRVACPWLIKHFVDPEAESWATMMRMCRLIPSLRSTSDPALSLLAAIVRADDSHPGNPHPAGEGCDGLRG
jgi:hypothetical protein